jgi:energy-coupling factor transporter ATP-binding protein EcfA2
MLKRLHLRNFTVFEDADFEFGEGLNVIVGTNGTGKSHVLKAGYAVEAVREEIKSDKASDIEKASLDAFSNEKPVPWGIRLYRYLSDVFLTKDLKNLVRFLRYGTRENSFVEATFNSEYTHENTIGFELDAKEGSLRIADGSIPIKSIAAVAPIFIPAKEVLSFFRGFGAINRRYHLDFDQVYTDLIDALELPALRHLPPHLQKLISEVLQPIMEGRIALEDGGFYLYPNNGGRFEINLVAEGIRKFGMVAQLLNNGSLTSQATLYWDEPEANLNPALLKALAAVLAALARAGFQIILATHSLFLLKELHILSRQEKLPVKYFALYAGENGATQVETKNDFIQLEHVVALDAELTQTFDFEDALDQDYAGDN